MALTVEDNCLGIHGECRPESFVIYDDFGVNSFQMSWALLPELESLVRQFRAYAEKHGKLPGAARACSST